MNLELWQLLVLILGPTGGAWVGVKASLNGMRSDVTDIKADVKKLHDGQFQNRERIVAVETKMETLRKP